jgi:hypothetical protein
MLAVLLASVTASSDVASCSRFVGNLRAENIALLRENAELRMIVASATPEPDLEVERIEVLPACFAWDHSVQSGERGLCAGEMSTGTAAKLSGFTAYCSCAAPATQAALDARWNSVLSPQVPRRYCV